VAVWSAASKFLTGPQKSQADATAKRLYKLAEALVSLCSFCFHLLQIAWQNRRKQLKLGQNNAGNEKRKFFDNRRVFQ
jgi:hypothetical protein